MTDLTSRLEALSPAQRAALLARLGKGTPGTGGPGTRSDQIEARVRDGEPAPLSATQQNMWFLEQFYPGTSMHVMSGAAKLPFDVPPAIFADALAEVIERHHVLRTRFEIVDGDPVARVAPATRPEIRVLESLPAAELWRQLTEDAQTPFDIVNDPLTRATLARTEDGESWVQLTLHHLVADGYSTGIIFSELGQLITGRMVGQMQFLPPVPFQYADVALWESDRAETDADDAEIDYWTGVLAGAPTALTLPIDHPRPAQQSYRGRRTEFELTTDQAAALRAFSARQGVTPFVTILAAYSIVLTRWSAQDSVVVGVPVAQRSQSGTDKVIGPFLNTLPFLVRLEDEERADRFLGRVNATVREGFAHQNAPFDRVLAALDLGRDPARPPLFQAILNVQENRSMPGMELRDLYNGCAKFDILLNITTTAQGIGGNVDVAADLFDQETVDALIDSFVAVLLALIESDAATRVSPEVDTLPLTSTPIEIDAPQPQRLEHSSLEDYVLSAVSGRADEIAIVSGDERITYAELDSRTRELATSIRALVESTRAADPEPQALAGGEPGEVSVGLLLPRSSQMIIAMLATLRAGYSFVPLDPAYPADRLKYVCGDAAIPALITSAEHLAAVPGLELPWLDPDTGTGPGTNVAITGLAGAETSFPGSELDPATRVAYLLYTSGSTGNPKGVRVSHRNVMTFLAAMRDEPGMTDADTLLAVTSPSFDIAILELLLPLAVGGRVVLASTDDARDGDRLAQLLIENEVTVMQATPTTWHLLLEGGWTGHARLRALCGGEAMPASLAKSLLERTAELWNMYGPTETTIWSTVHRVTAADVDRGAIPIGHPISGTQILVADAAHAPVPDGVFGELCIIGDGVTLGYHQRPELNIERFVNLAAARGEAGAPRHASSGLRAYRTGDLVRRRRDGRIEFGGRIDTQVKVRGFRVELGEVEAALEAALPGIRAIAAVDAAGAAIVAYLECAADDLGDTVELLGALRETLPPYMIPSGFATLERFPLTPNGKVDRKAIGASAAVPLALNSAAGRAEFVAARTPLEAELASIWQELLGLDSVPGVHDDFFLLGGHSLLATKLVFRVRERLQLVVPLPVLFAGELTIERLAHTLENGLEANTLDLAAEVVLPDEIRPAEGALIHSVTDPKNLFMTGATGFVGSFLLAELLETSAATAWCLVRAEDETQGFERIKSAMLKYGIWKDEYAPRIVVLTGNLTEDRLGMSEQAWTQIAATADGIIHCGADVNFLRPYQTLKSANVTGTVQILALACEGAVKPVHFVSTTYVFSRFSYPPDTVFSEADRDPIQNVAYTFGYTQSKWVGEQLIFEARRRGIPTFVYRTGRVAGHSQTGACQESDFLWQTIRLGITMGSAPIMDMATDITPVDYVVGAIAHLARKQELVGNSFHVVSAETTEVPDLVRWMEEYGYVGEPVPFARWCEMVAERAETEGDAAAGAMAPFLSATPLDKMPDATFDASNVHRGLADTTIVCPPIDGVLLRRYFDWFVETGYFPAPAHKAIEVHGAVEVHEAVEVLP